MTGQTQLFGPFRFDMGERLLYRGSDSVPLTPKAAEALYWLLEKRGTLVEKSELIRLLWPDTVVEQATLSQHIFVLRKLLGGDANEYIETIPRRGFRFVDSVREPAFSRRKRLALIGLAIVVLSTATAMAWRSWARRKANVAPQNSAIIAVLPFHAIHDEQDRYLGVAMADALISRLSNIRGVQVRPTSAVRKFTALVDPVAAGRELNVSAVVEGTIQRADGHLRVSVQLVDISRDAPRWSETFDIQEADVFAVQDRISEKIAAALSINLTRQPFRYTENAAARNDYLRGRYFWNKRTADGYMSAIDSFQRAIGKDPSYALAYDGLADSYALLGSMTNRFMPRSVALPKAFAAVNRALQLDGKLAEAHASLGFLKMHYNWDWDGGEREFRRAIELNPGYATAHHWYAFELAGLSRFDEAIHEIREAQKDDPVSIIINNDVAEILYFAGRYDEAIAQCQRTIELDPNFALVYLTLSRSQRQMGRYAEAASAARKGIDTDPSRLDLLIDLAGNYQALGRPADARKTIDEWRRRAAGKYEIYFDGNTDPHDPRNRERAFVMLERLYAEHSGSLILLNVDPGYASMRDDPRFKSLVHRLGLDRVTKSSPPA